VVFRCHTADNVTWLNEASWFQFRLSHEWITEASFMNVVCDVGLCGRGEASRRHDDASGGSHTHSSSDVLPQV